MFFFLKFGAPRNRGSCDNHDMKTRGIMDIKGCLFFFERGNGLYLTRAWTNRWTQSETFVEMSYFFFEIPTCNLLKVIPDPLINHHEINTFGEILILWIF